MRMLSWLAASAVGVAAAGAPPAPAPAPRKPVTDTYWGVSVADDYRYLEDPADAATRRFASQQNERTRQWLDSRPERAAILKRVVELTHDETPDFYGLRYAGGRLFAMKRQPPNEQPMLVVFPPGDALSGERALVDPNVIDPGGSTSIDFFVPSLDGARVAVSLSSDGTESGTLHVYEVESGRKLADSIARVNGGTAGGSAAWTADGSGLYYTRYPRAGERPEADLPFYQQVWYHALGTPESQDGYVLGREFPRIAEIELTTSEDGRYMLAQVENGDGGEFQYWLKGPELDWTRVADFKDLVICAELGPDGWLYLMSRHGAPHMKIMRVRCAEPLLSKAEVVVAESDAVIRSFLPAASRLYVIEMLGGPTRLRVLDLAAKTSTVLGAEEPATLSELVRLEGDEILLRRQSYLSPPAVLRYGPGMQTFQATPLVHRSKADFSDCTVRRELASAADGTKIPITLLMRKGVTADGTNPLLLYAYGSYGSVMGPSFSAARRVWVEQGGIYAVANVRGGGEFGDEWHRAANLENKRVTVDDFVAAARHLVESRYTSRERLAIEGRSAGGLLIFATVVHYPQVCRAAVAHVGIGDMLRVEKSPNGQFNVTEFGTVEDERQFHAMHALSPYHNVKAGTAYPPILITTGLNDPRVEPWQSFKMAAKLQASGAPNPVLLRVSEGTGHGGGTGLTERDELLADTYTFLFAALDAPYR